MRCDPCVGKERSTEPPEASATDSLPAEVLDYGTAGVGARRRYEHLHDQREQRARETYGRLGVAATRLAGDPQHVKAWKTGAEGEERIARRLAKLLKGKGVLLLHDRRIPGSVANIDHIAIGPGGVTVIDAKNVKGKVAIERTGGLRNPRVENLRIGGRDRTKLVDGIERQVVEVRAALTALGHGDVDVAAALCFADPEGLPTFSKLEVRGVALRGPRRTAKLAARSGPLGPERVEAIRDGLAARLPAA